MSEVPFPSPSPAHLPLSSHSSSPLPHCFYPKTSSPPQILSPSYKPSPYLSNDLAESAGRKPGCCTHWEQLWPLGHGSNLLG